MLFFFKYLFVWLFWVLVVARRTFDLHCGMQTFACSMQTLSCGMWDLVPWPGIKPRSPAWGAQSLSNWTTREVLRLSLFMIIGECPWIGVWFKQSYLDWVSRLGSNSRSEVLFSFCQGHMLSLLMLILITWQRQGLSAFSATHFPPGVHCVLFAKMSMHSP